MKVFKLPKLSKNFFIFYFLFTIYYSNSSVLYLITFIYLFIKLRSYNYIYLLSTIPLIIIFYDKFDYLINLIPFLSSYSYSSTYLLDEGYRSKLLSLYYVFQNIDIFLLGKGPGFYYNYLSQSFSEISFDGFILRQISEYGFIGLILYFVYIRKLIISVFPRITIFSVIVITLLSSSQYLFIDPSLLITLFILMSIINNTHHKNEIS